MKLTCFRIIFLTLLSTVSVQANAIHCKLAASKTEKLICESRDLKSLDDSLNHVYRAALAKSGKPELIKAQQKDWVTEVQSTCTTSDCLNSAYLSQVAHLKAAMAIWCKAQQPKFVGVWARHNGGGFFEEFVAGPDGSLDSWLHQRPEFSGATWKLNGCDVVISNGTGMTVEWILIDVTKTELRVLELGVPGIDIYRSIRN
jgi:uncharacterized protein YecT (DUF1311 family)